MIGLQTQRRMAIAPSVGLSANGVVAIAVPYVGCGLSPAEFVAGACKNGFFATMREQSDMSGRYGFALGERFTP